jgi:hypothetical protein
MSRSSRSLFQAIRSEGGLLPTDLLQRVAQGDRDLGGVRAEDYHLTDLPLNEAVVRSWNRLVGTWAHFRDARSELPQDDPATTLTRERWLLVLFEELRFGRLQTARAVEIDGKSYPVSHVWEHVPIHLVGCNVPLDRRSARVAGAATHSPHGLLQELLNRSEERLWGFVSNGLLLRLLRDNSSFTRQAYLEFDLEQMMESEAYSDFVLLWLTSHQSRVEGERPYECWLERWSQEAAKQGTRALDSLRDGVETAIRELGSGFLTPGRNAELRDALRSGGLSKQDYYRQLLRLVYRLLFLFVAEDRGLLHNPRAPDTAKERYDRWYSTRRLRDLAQRRRGTKHSDLWEGMKPVMAGLSNDDGCTPLGLPALGSFLWSDRALPDLDRAQLPNRALLEAVRALATVRDGKVLRVVDYKNLGAEELGSVYESLLELHPELDADAGAFALRAAAGSERKTTGSYYTPTSLISALLDSALDTVLDDATVKGEDAVLRLRVADPACGSGHFLVAAAHRIAKRLAAIRTGDEEPSPEATRHALRDVVGRCIYGVDINPMAVELCKVSLWLEALDPGRPLSFLDAHIRCGNSLLGTTPELLAEGIPDGAFKPIEGDDKTVTSELRKRNKQEREGQLSLEDEWAEFEVTLAAEAAELEAVSDDSLAGVREKARLFDALEESETYRHSKLAADAWCAAFVQRKTKEAHPQITQGLLRRIARDSAGVPVQTVCEIERLSAEYRFFHWYVDFAHVFADGESGGFDCILGNPPWDQIQLDDREFFAASRPEIAAATNMAARKRLIAELAASEPELHTAYLGAVRSVEGVQHFVHDSGCFPLTSYGRLNLAPLYAEHMRRLTARTGRVGAIVPSGIATDSFNQFFFRDIVDRQSLLSLFSFENEEFIFPAVHHSTKFALLTLTGADRQAEAAEFAFFLREVSALADFERRFTLTPEDFALLNPNTGTCAIFRTSRDAEITKSIYRRVPVLVNESRGQDGNAWNFRGLLMFMMNTDSHLFHTEPAPGRVPLYEGKMVHQFDHRFGTYRCQTDAQAAQGKLPELDDEQHCDPTLLPAPRYWVDETEVAGRLDGRWERGWLLGWRDITSAVVLRTVIVALIPRVAVGNNFPLALTEPSAASAACLSANLNAFALDYAARQKLGGTHLNFFIFTQLPVFDPASYNRQPQWANEMTLSEWVVPRVLELTYTAWDLEPFARDLSYDGSPFRWDPARRFLLRCELDAAFFHLYGLERDNVAYVMDTFWVVRDRDVRAHGEYRTKRVILEIYDDLAQAMASGEPYETRLDPPPADPRVAHRPRTEADVGEARSAR